MQLKLTSRYTLVMAGTVLAIVSVLVLLFASQLRKSGDELRAQSTGALQTSLSTQIEQRGEDIASILAERMVNPLYTLDMSAMREALEETLMIDGVERAVIVDAQGRIVHDGSMQVTQFGELLANAEDTNSNRAHIVVPMALGDDPLGAVHLDMTLTPALREGQRIDRQLRSLQNDHMREAIRDVVLYAAALFLGGLLLAMLIARNFARPILALADYARAVGQGRSEQLPGRERSDEIGFLAGSLEQMSRDLSQTSGEAAYLAYHDSLTRLPNRAHLKRSLEQAIQRCTTEETSLALLFIDLDDFKKVNDTLGHEAGDTFLIKVADRLSAMVNSWNAANTSRASLSRLGGDEFTIAVTQLDNRSQAEAIASLVIESLREPIAVNEQGFKIGASVGITVCPSDSDDLNSLLRYADRAMYRAKQQGRNTFRFFDRARDGTATRESSLETDLEQVLSDRGLTLHYQPIVNAANGEVVAVEALARWHHPVLGYVQPSRFVQLAEETGRIEHLDKSVISQLIEDMALIRDAGFATLQASANIASMHLDNATLITHLEEALGRTGIDGNLLRLEVREKAVMRHLEFASANMQRLRALGVNIWIDNFGTRIATLKHIDMLPVSGIKIDSQFIDGITQGNNPRIVTQAITDMCHNMRLPVIAEAVEHPEQLEYLQSIGCDYAQGYLFARPMPLEELLGYLAQHCQRDHGDIIVLQDHFAK